MHDLTHILTAHQTPVGNCSACCFRNYSGMCEKMLCSDGNNNFFWTAQHCNQLDLMLAWSNFVKSGANITQLCRQKIEIALYLKMR